MGGSSQVGHFLTTALWFCRGGPGTSHCQSSGCVCLMKEANLFAQSSLRPRALCCAVQTSSMLLEGRDRVNDDQSPDRLWGLVVPAAPSADSGRVCS